MGLERDVKSSEATHGNLLTSNLLFGRPTECAGPVPGGEAAAHLCGSASFLHLHQQTKCECLTRTTPVTMQVDFVFIQAEFLQYCLLQVSAACTVMLVPSGLFDSSCKCRVCELSQSAVLYRVPFGT